MQYGKALRRKAISTNQWPKSGQSITTYWYITRKRNRFESRFPLAEQTTESLRQANHLVVRIFRSWRPTDNGTPRPTGTVRSVAAIRTVARRSVAGSAGAGFGCDGFSTGPLTDGLPDTSAASPDGRSENRQIGIAPASPLCVETAAVATKAPV